MAPENTVRAVASAAERADAVEIDVRRCGSDDLVVIHDEVVDRVTDRSGAVTDFTADELADCNVLGSGEGVPRLREVYETVPPAVTVHLELKELGLGADAIAAAGTETDLIVSSFRPAALAECREAAATVPTALLFQRAPHPKLSLARALDCAYVHPHHELAGTVTPLAHDAGMGVNVWTLEDRATAERMAEQDVDGVIADNPTCWTPERQV